MDNRLTTPIKCISQEGLKLLACLTMLIDHIGASLMIRLVQETSAQTASLVQLYYLMRIIGRIAFPIYCFLLVEGAHYTRNPKKYGLRLFVGLLLSEIPFDLALSFRGPVFFDWTGNSVMVTLLLGFGMIQAMKRVKGFWKIVPILPFYLLAEWLHTDYGGLGILIIAVFALTKDMPRENLLRAAGLCLVIYPGSRVYLGSAAVNLEWFAALALIPIFCYDGRKLTHSKGIQWAFYLFYPVHLVVLALLEAWIFG